MDLKAMYKLSYGLFVLTTRVGDKDNGCITNTAIQVASDPNRIAFAVNKANLTHDMVLESGIFNISVISKSASFDLFKKFGFQSGRNVNKFADYDSSAFKRTENNIICILNGTNAYISGKVYSTVDLGSHTLFIADITDMEVLNDDESCTYDYYQSNIKSKPAQAEAGGNVNSKSSEEGSTLKVEGSGASAEGMENGQSSSGKTVWRCRICGYEYEGEELPADFVCPWCKHPASDFEKVVNGVVVS